MRTREEIKADYFKDCGYEDGDFITTDEDYLLEEIFKVQNQAKNNEVLDLVSKTLMSEYKEEKPLILKNILYEFTDHKTSSINEVDFEDVVKRIIEET